MALDPFTEGIGFARAIVDKIFPNAENKEQRAQDVAKMLSDRDAKRDQDQSEINKIEAGSTSLFVAGWRPFIGWVCGSSLAYVWIGRDMFMWAIAIGHWNVPPPPLVMQDQMLELILGILGLGGLRSWEKIKGAR